MWATILHGWGPEHRATSSLFEAELPERVRDKLKQYRDELDELRVFLPERALCAACDSGRLDFFDVTMEI